MAHKIIVGLSGGVDSATAAALLKEDGREVVGAFIKIWQPEFFECTWREDRLDAMRVAAALGIPFLEVDLSEEYKNEVIEKMLASYRSGETPNPDVMCNRSIKFGAFARWAKQKGADAVATGHYARTKKGTSGTELWRGVDTEKDQSYFLHRLGERDLARAVFPLGELTKKQVRAKARSLKLPVAEKPDSQGLCFVGDVTMRDFLKRYLTVEEGRVTDKKGHIIGTHEGAALYTVGQRHGFSITRAGYARVPYYVTAIDTTRNIVVVSAERADAECLKIMIRDIHWIAEAPALPFEVSAQTRYREKPEPISITRDAGGTSVTFRTPHVVSPGQSIVFYDGDRVLGGAIMEKEHATTKLRVHSAGVSSVKALQ
jgi:tRNA-specific 2-thiouridylase